jgi:hypothetical protein
MKQLILFISIVLLTISLNAQTNSSMIFSDAHSKYQKMETAGTIMSAIGGVAVFTGTLFYRKIYNDQDEENPGTKARIYKDIIIGGIGVMAVGIPLWAIGKSKLRHIEIEARVVNFKGYANASGLGISIRF